MLDVMNKINNQMNKKKFTGIIVLDLRKAYGTVSHDILYFKKNYIVIVFVVWYITCSDLTSLDVNSLCILTGAIPQLKQYNLVFFRNQTLVPYFSLFMSTMYSTFFTLLLSYTQMTLAYMSKLQKDLESLNKPLS